MEKIFNSILSNNYLLAVDGALVSTESDVVNTTDVEARGTNTVGILEGSNEGLNFGGLDLRGKFR